MFKKGEIRFRTFNVLDDQPSGFSRLIGKVTAAVEYTGVQEDNTEAYLGFKVGFSYCSPKEKQSNRKLGQAIALMRLTSPSHHGPCYLYLPQQDPDAPKMTGLTGAIKDLIVAEARRKCIRWMKGINQYQLV